MRFYNYSTVNHLDFDLFHLSREQFCLMWLCLQKDNLLNDIPLKIKESSVLQEENITKKLYADYSKFRTEIYNNLIKNNIGDISTSGTINASGTMLTSASNPMLKHGVDSDISPEVINPTFQRGEIGTTGAIPAMDKLLLFKKTQKLLDRFLFVFFAEDRLLLPPNSINEIIKQWTILKDDLDEYCPYT